MAFFLLVDFEKGLHLLTSCQEVHGYAYKSSATDEHLKPILRWNFPSDELLHVFEKADLQFRCRSLNQQHAEVHFDRWFERSEHTGLLLLSWVTEGKLHAFDTTSTTYAGLVLLLLPRFGVMTWKDVQARILWGAVIVFGVGISLGTALLTTQAGQWLGVQVVGQMGLDKLGTLGVFAVLSAFLILIHLGFASATALTSALIPILMAVLQTLPRGFQSTGRYHAPWVWLRRRARRQQRQRFLAEQLHRGRCLRTLGVADVRVQDHAAVQRR